MQVSNQDRMKVRLAGIDAPEKAQDFGSASKKHHSDKVFGRTATVEWTKMDKYGRVIGRVLLDGDDVCLEQVRAGLAWHYKAYAKELAKSQRLAYSAAEDQARLDKAGLWRLSEIARTGESSVPCQLAGMNRPGSCGGPLG